MIWHSLKHFEYFKVSEILLKICREALALQVQVGQAF
jgi:hypothetical protein